MDLRPNRKLPDYPSLRNPMKEIKITGIFNLEGK